MKTRGYKTVHALASILCTFTVLYTFTICIFMIFNIRFIQLEADVIPRREFTLSSALKLMIFFNTLAALLTGYSFNVSSKALMKMCNYVIVPILLFTTYILYYFFNEYPRRFGNMLKTEMYSKARLVTELRTIFTDWNDREIIGQCAQRMVNLSAIFFYYNLFCFVVFIVLMMLVSYARGIKINEPKLVVPAITEMSKAGLNTVSLRNKRVVLGTL